MQQIVASVVFVGCLFAAAVCDLRMRRVPNALNAALALTGIGAVWLGVARGGVSDAALAAACALAAGIVMQFLRLMGGGDVKLAAAMAIWLGPLSMTAWLVTAVAGGVLALFFVRQAATRTSADGVRPDAGFARLQLDDGPDTGRVPYAVALAVGGVWAWFGGSGLY